MLRLLFPDEANSLEEGIQIRFDGGGSFNRTSVDSCGKIRGGHPLSIVWPYPFQCLDCEFGALRCPRCLVGKMP